MKGEKLDLVREAREEYRATRQPILLTVRPARYLVVGGAGEPGSDSFQIRLGALYGIAFTVKMARKKGGQDYKVCPLEAVYGDPREKDPQAVFRKSRDSWAWRLVVRTPEWIEEEDLARAASELRSRGKPKEVEEVRLLDLDEGECVQALHVGPYEEEGPTVESMLELARSEGARPAGLHHEIYLSDPRRVEPERLKTILRWPVERASAVPSGPARPRPHGRRPSVH